MQQHAGCIFPSTMSSAFENQTTSYEPAPAVFSPNRESANEIAEYFDRLWPIMRSITGDGVRRSHDILSELVPLKRSEIPSGTRCYDWTVPKEWFVREAYLTDPSGKRIADIANNTLHLVSYSIPYRGRVSRQELEQHLYSIPDQPDAVPYMTSYYEPRWGFCLSHNVRKSLHDGTYEVVIDSGHVDGSMTMSEAILPGEEPGEVLISTYTCHPSMGNNELSGPLVAAFLYRRLAALPRRRLTYRFVFLPETIGSIAYLSLHGDHLTRNMVAGYVLTCIGDRAPFTYKRSRRGGTLADRACLYALRQLAGDQLRVLDFAPSGSDERQYCSPGFNLPVGVIARSIFGKYKEYHTSLDNRDFICFEKLVESVDACFAACSVLDKNIVYRNLLPFGEPHLGSRNLYPTLGGARRPQESVTATKWLLNLSDGEHDLLGIAERSGISFEVLHEVAERCISAELLERVR
jgi:aminopeptidase-like protein